jgi:hypothetical protein
MHLKIFILILVVFCSIEVYLVEIPHHSHSWHHWLHNHFLLIQVFLVVLSFEGIPTDWSLLVTIFDELEQANQVKVMVAGKHASFF